MRRTHLRAAALAAALALPAAGHLLPRAAAAQRAKKPRVDARAVYMRNCARCHGAEGAADTEQGEVYNATNFTDADWWRRERPNNSRLRRVIVQGGYGMPAFGKRLSAAEIDALVPLVRSFKGK
ncbi:MAG: cytochrome c [Acidobacteria bacterium]|nr:cytochrome c [Acidobacteriota bacterium]